MKKIIRISFYFLFAALCLYTIVCIGKQIRYNQLSIYEKQDFEFQHLIKSFTKLDTMPEGFRVEIYRDSTFKTETCHLPKQDIKEWKDFETISVELPLPYMMGDRPIFLSVHKNKDAEGVYARFGCHAYGKGIWSGSSCPFHAGIEGLTFAGIFSTTGYSQEQTDSLDYAAVLLANEIMAMHEK